MRPGRCQRAIATGLAVALGLTALPASAAARLRTPGARVSPAQVELSSRPITRPIPPGFLGLAFEFGQLPAWIPPGATQVDPVLLQLIRNLDPGARPVIRIGGLSTDRSWWPVPGMTTPLGVTDALGPSWVDSTVALARALDARLTLGVNLEADSVRVARTEADAFLRLIPRQYLAALDLGNEPPLYDSVPWYRLYHGRVVPWYENYGADVFSRGPAWGPAAFANDYRRLLGALPRVPILGPDTQNPAYFAAFHRFLSPRSRVRIVASHGYGLNNCVTQPAAAPYPTVAHLLDDYALHDLLGQLGSDVALAHHDGASFRIDEMGSVTCNGRVGVSDTMASALWAVGALASVAQDGVDGVNLHTVSGLPNALFDFDDTGDGWTGSVHPIYYGALLFAQAAPAGSRMLRLSLSGPRSLHVWATVDRRSTHRLLLLNDSQSGAVTVTLRPPRDWRSAGGRLERLLAPGASARGGVSLGGRTFGPATRTGRLRPPVAERVLSRHGVYPVTLPPASAALLILDSR